MKKGITPLSSVLKKLVAGQELLFSGVLYTARDQAHARLVASLKQGKKLPFPLNGAMIYYCGPTGTPAGKVIGSCGPTTSSRMDEFTPALLAAGAVGMIGKGSRSRDVVAAIKKYKAVYFVTYAGCGALLQSCVRSKKVVAYPDLGPEAIYRLEVENFPLIVAIDSRGKSIYQPIENK